MFWLVVPALDPLYRAMRCLSAVTLCFLRMVLSFLLVGGVSFGVFSDDGYVSC